MDQALTAIAEFVSATDSSSIPSRAVELTKHHLVDTVACGAGACASPTAQKLRRAMPPMEVTGGASMYGVAAKATPEIAGFVNASFNRCLDFNDFGPTGHPSDMMAPLLAFGEDAGATGRDVLRGIYVAYEVATSIADIVPVFDIEWDMGIYLGAGAAAGMASIVGLDPDATAHAVSMAVVPNSPLRITRQSPTSEWRSAATAYTGMAATFACRLARSGVTGPTEPFQGDGGLFESVLRNRELQLGALGSSPSAIERGSLKPHAACFEAQSAIDAALRVRSRVETSAIRHITVHTTPGTWWYIGGGRGDREQRWSPTTREMADHSIPYILANVFLDGRVDPSTYSDERLARREWADLIGRLDTASDPELSSISRSRVNPARVTVELANGDVVSELSTFPWDDDGRSTVSVDDVKAKFSSLIDGVLPDDDAAALEHALFHFESIDDLDDVTRFLRRFECAATTTAAS